MSRRLRQRTVHVPTVKRHVELLLAEDVDSLGKQGQIVSVRPGYARNFLLPQGLATIASTANKRLVEKHRERLADLAVKRRDVAKGLAKKVASYSVTLEANCTAEGHLYGSIVGTDISRALKTAGYEVETSHVRLDGPLKECGMYTVKLQLHPEVDSEVKVWVVPMARGT